MCRGFAGSLSSFRRRLTMWLCDAPVLRFVHDAPDLGEHRLALDDLERPREECLQHFAFVVTENELFRAALDAAGVEVDARVADLHGGLRDDGVAGPPEGGADAREEFLYAERFRHVVVGAEFEPAHLVDLLTAGGEHDDRCTEGPSGGVSDTPRSHRSPGA